MKLTVRDKRIKHGWLIRIEWKEKMLYRLLNSFGLISLIQMTVQLLLENVLMLSK